MARASLVARGSGTGAAVALALSRRSRKSVIMIIERLPIGSQDILKLREQGDT